MRGRGSARSNNAPRRGALCARRCVVCCAQRGRARRTQLALLDCPWSCCPRERGLSLCLSRECDGGFRAPLAHSTGTPAAAAVPPLALHHLHTTTSHWLPATPPGTRMNSNQTQTRPRRSSRGKQRLPSGVFYARKEKTLLKKRAKKLGKKRGGGSE